MIDLHLHTTASDGHCTPAELVDRAAAAGLTVMAATDHDTTAAARDVASHAAARGIDAVTGIEMTAVEQGRDVHVLGYFVDPADAPLIAFLEVQRAARVTRVHQIGERLASLGVPIDVAGLLAEHGRHPGRSIGRPQVARALQRAGHVADVREAFDRFLAQDGPAFVPRAGCPAEQVIAVIQAAGGLASLAHPGRTRIDARIADLAAAGLDGLEVYHSDHGPDEVNRYRGMALALGLLMTGGSDFHGDPARALEPGASTLPAAEWQRLRAEQRRHACR